MNFIEAKEFFHKLYEGKKIDWVFDNSCINKLECIVIDGIVNLLHQVEFKKVKMIVDDADATYVPINAHRTNMTWQGLKDLLSSFINATDEVHINDAELKNLSSITDIELYNQSIQQLQSASGLTADKIIEKVNDYIARTNPPTSQPDAPVLDIVNNAEVPA